MPSRVVLAVPLLEFLHNFKQRAAPWELKFVTGGHISFTLEREAEGTAMTMIELSDSQAAALKAKAALQGLTLKAWLEKLAEESPANAPRRPLKTGRGMLAKYGPAPSAEEIDENSKDMFHRFGENF